MKAYKNYDREEYLREFNKIMDLKPSIDKYMEEIVSNGVKNLILAGVGGTMAVMMPWGCFAKKRSNFPVFVENAAELPLGVNHSFGPESLVVLYSDSGTTAETVALAKYCKEHEITTIGISCTADTPLLDELKYSIFSSPSDYYSCDGDYMRLALIVASFLNHVGEFDDYELFCENLAKMPNVMADVKEKYEDDAREYSFSIKDEPYHMLISAGNMWGSTYCFAMCYLEEMQWLKTKAVTAPEFFHGTLELVEKDTNIMIFKGEDETRQLIERAENFAKKVSNKVKVIDTAEFEAEGIDEKFRPDFAPFLLEAYLGRMIANLEDATGHSLDIRRYYRVMEY